MDGSTAFRAFQLMLGAPFGIKSFPLSLMRALRLTLQILCKGYWNLWLDIIKSKHKLLLKLSRFSFLFVKMYRDEKIF
jgi:hypothetical protein